MKYVIINADDFGWSTAVNAGIVKAFDEGILTSASLIVNGPAYGHALELIRPRPGLGVGVHLNLLRGKPVLPASRLKAIVNDSGLFACNIPLLLLKAQLSSSARSCMEDELSAQIEKALADGVAVTHLDSERHVHFFPAIHRIVVRLAARHGIRRLRHIRRGGRLPGRRGKVTGNHAGLVKERLLVLLERLNRARVEREKLGSPDYLLGIAETGRLTADVMEALLRCLPEGVSEIMCHPGYMDEETTELESLLGPASINVRREGELAALLQPRLKAIADERGIRLIHYGDLPPRK